MIQFPKKKFSRNVLTWKLKIKIAWISRKARPSISTMFMCITIRDQVIVNMLSFHVQGSTAISSADLFGRSSDDSALDVTASDLINRLSFQVMHCIYQFARFPRSYTAPSLILWILIFPGTTGHLVP